MPLCVAIVPEGSALTIRGGDGVANAKYPTIISDPTCASGLQILTASEIQANKNQLTVDSQSDPQRVQDMTDLFYAFLLVLVSVWAIKQLANLFTGDTSKD